MPEAPAYVALLRAVNLGPHNKVAMADLRAMMEQLGFEEPKTLLQSGNLVFRAAKTDGPKLEVRLRRETAKRLGLDTEFFVRDEREWGALVAANPFPDEARADPSHLLVVCCEAVLRLDAVAAPQAAIAGRERVKAVGKQAYIVYPDGIGTSKVTNALLERKLGCRGTGRNWNTVIKLARALSGDAGST